MNFKSLVNDTVKFDGKLSLCLVELLGANMYK